MTCPENCYLPGEPLGKTLLDITNLLPMAGIESCGVAVHQEGVERLYCLMGGHIPAAAKLY